MLARVVLYLGIVVVGLMLLLDQPTPMAIAPREVQPNSTVTSG
jgi:hypothetical protein